jgi:hypothetical protein
MLAFLDPEFMYFMYLCINVFLLCWLSSTLNLCILCINAFYYAGFPRPCWGLALLFSSLFVDSFIARMGHTDLLIHVSNAPPT